ncbi:hypothetical protein JOL79_16405 [Microbispora sp. RL4-1S]|uniref:Apea-like HEPN domain-containing protein n=1 Tax=Microbispora oryzae TaxID=2806554 RepID=A0A940WI90_9ACTN|nr:HEPN domain-containing protein [Microbispora oryzae]MBP2705398.1 hypothetical protein [Microbispora oryzae]
MANSDVEGVDLSVLAWVHAAVGEKLVAYLLSCEQDRVHQFLSGDAPFSQEQSDVVAAFANLRRMIPNDFDLARSREVVTGWLTLDRQNDRSVARNMHEHTSGGQADVPARDDLQRSLISLALDAYPAFLLPAEPSPIPLMDETSFRVTQAIYRHPEAEAFCELFLHEPALETAFQRVEGSGHVAMVYRSTGQGGTLQLLMIPHIILNLTWRHIEDNASSPEAFAVQAVRELQLIRAALSGRPRSISAKFAFTGIILPPGSQFDIDGGQVRPFTEAEKRLAPPSLDGQVSSTDSSGNTTVANYAGDVVVEYKIPYRVRIERHDATEANSFPEDMRPPIALGKMLTRLRFSLMLAVEREFRVQLIPTWTYFDDPLSTGINLSWNDPRQGAGFVPTQLSEEEVRAWSELYRRLNAPEVERIDLALSRILRAVAERRDPGDVLIDSVIAWENLFGTREGEPTFRITMSLATLLETEPAAREKLRSSLSSIYRLRSNVVHGSDELKADDYPRCQEALDIAIRSVRALIMQRPDILRLPDGGRRSTALLLGVT